MAKSIRGLTLGFSLGRDLRVMRSNLATGSMLGVEFA